MSVRRCIRGHTYEKTSSCPVCPVCSREEMMKKYGSEFPQIGAPAFRALDSIGVTQLSQLTEMTQKQLLKLHGFGPRALRLVQERLTEQGMSLANEV